MRLLRWVAAISLLITLMPVILTVVAFLSAGALGCQLDEGSIHPCNFLGMNIGGTLYTLGMMFWFFFVTLPLAGAIMVVWVLVEVIRGVKRATST
jgi:hypothetical protein